MLSDDVSVTDDDGLMPDFGLLYDELATLDGLSLPRNFLGSEVVLSGGGLLLGDGLFSTCEKSVSSVSSSSLPKAKCVTSVSPLLESVSPPVEILWRKTSTAFECGCTGGGYRVEVCCRMTYR